MSATNLFDLIFILLDVSDYGSKICRDLIHCLRVYFMFYRGISFEHRIFTAVHLRNPFLSIGNIKLSEVISCFTSLHSDQCPPTFFGCGVRIAELFFGFEQSFICRLDVLCFKPAIHDKIVADFSRPSYRGITSDGNISSDCHISVKLLCRN